jgi:hypothetical protein
MVVQVIDTKLASSPYSTCASSYQKLSYYAFAGRLLLWHIKMFHRTEQCCETTARHASDLGWQVDYCLEATLTWDMRNLDGSVLTAQDIRTRTATVLQDRFAHVCTVEQALERAV